MSISMVALGLSPNAPFYYRKNTWIGTSRRTKQCTTREMKHKIVCRQDIDKDSEYKTPGRFGRRTTALLGLIALGSMSTIEYEPVAYAEEAKYMPFPSKSSPHGEPTYQMGAASDTEQAIPGVVPLGFLNSLGVVGAGILGALFLLEKKAKSMSDLALESANLMLQKAEANLITMKETMESSLLEQKQVSLKELETVNQEKMSLSKDLHSSKKLAKELSVELSTQKALMQNMQNKVESLQSAVEESEKRYKSLHENFSNEKARSLELENQLQLAEKKMEEKDTVLSNLTLSFNEKENHCQNLLSELDTARGDLSKTSTKLQKLENEISELRQVLIEKENNLEAETEKLSAATAKGEQSLKLLKSVEQELDATRKSASRDLSLANERLAVKETEIQKLTSQLTGKLNEVKEKEMVIADLHADIQRMKQIINEEKVTIRNLTEKLNIASKDLENSKIEVSSLSKEMEKSNEQKDQLKRELAELQIESETTINLLTTSLGEEQGKVSSLRKQIAEAEKDLVAASQSVSDLQRRLEDAITTNNKLQGKLGEAINTVEFTTNKLNEERRKAANAAEEVLATKSALETEQMLVQSLESELSKAKVDMNGLRASLDSLCKDLEDANVKVSILDAEKASLEENILKEKAYSTKLHEKAMQAEAALVKLLEEKQTAISKALEIEEGIMNAEAKLSKLKEQTSLMASMIKSAGLRMESIAQVGTETVSLLKKLEEGITDSAEKECLYLQGKHLQDQAGEATDIAMQMKEMELIVSNLDQKFDEVYGLDVNVKNGGASQGNKVLVTTGIESSDA